MKYNRTSLAYSTEEIDVENSQEKTASTKTQQRKKKSNAYRFFILCALYLLAIACAPIMKSTQVALAKQQLNQEKAAYNEILNENKRLEVAINTEVDLRKVENIALTKLGMNKPLPSQIVYVNTNASNYGEVVAANKEEDAKKDTMWGSFVKSFMGIFAFSN